jgi:hypothetical protein
MPCAVGLVAAESRDDTAPSPITGHTWPAAANGIMAHATPARSVSTTDSVVKAGIRSSSGAEARPPNADESMRTIRNALTSATERDVQ